jgi:uncharacterized membrane protein YecN with MAPEG domain
MTPPPSFPVVTSLYAAAFGALHVALAVRVVAFRERSGVMHGDGGVDRLNRAIRAHGNFAENAPFILLLSLLLEMDGARPLTLNLLLAPLAIGRLMHPVGMMQPVRSRAQYALRGAGMVITWLVLLTACALLVLRVL